MKASSFLGETATTALPEGSRGSEDIAGPPQGAPEFPDQVATPAPSESAVVRDVTPAGTVIEYEASPKRLYRVGRLEQCRDCLVGDGLNNIPPELASRCSDCSLEMVEVPSVTTVLGILHKPALTWWGMQKGVQGVIDLFDSGVLTTMMDWDDSREILAVAQGEDAVPAVEESIVSLLKEHRLTVNHRLDQASERGVNVHDALEDWARFGRLPNAREFPPEEQGYVTGLLNFIEGHEIQPVACEVMVGIDDERGYAGRFDLVIEISEPVSLVTKCYPKREDKRTKVQPGRYLVDLKTSKGVYTTHHLQLAAYEFAATECGYEPTKAQAVLHVTADGEYEFVFSYAKPEQFLAIRKAYAALEELK